ncbi:MAG: zinc-dependent peptidase, partial [Bacteroidia bacterium]
MLLNQKDANIFLSEYFIYYNTLNEEWKHIFVRRVIQFAQTKTFIGREGFPINNKVKAIISASAVQLTLGLTEWQLSYFDTILLFPTDFFNHVTKQG